MTKELNSMVVRVDNVCAFECIKMGRELSKTRRRDLKILVNILEAYRCRVVAQHVRTEDNFVDGRLSRGHYELVEEYIYKNGHVVWGEDNGYMAEWEKYLVQNEDEGDQGDKANRLFS